MLSNLVKLSELEALEEGVKTENQRLQAIDSQRRCVLPNSCETYPDTFSIRHAVAKELSMKVLPTQSTSARTLKDLIGTVSQKGHAVHLFHDFRCSFPLL